MSRFRVSSCEREKEMSIFRYVEFRGGKKEMLSFEFRYIDISSFDISRIKRGEIY